MTGRLSAKGSGIGIGIFRKWLNWKLEFWKRWHTLGGAQDLGPSIRPRFELGKLVELRN